MFKKLSAISIISMSVFAGCVNTNNIEKDIINYYGMEINSKFKQNNYINKCDKFKTSSNSSFITCKDQNHYFDSIVVLTKNTKITQILLQKDFKLDKYGKKSINEYFKLKNILSQEFKLQKGDKINEDFSSSNENFCSNRKLQGGTIFKSNFINLRNKNTIEILLKGSKDKNDCYVWISYK